MFGFRSERYTRGGAHAVSKRVSHSPSLEEVRLAAIVGTRKGS
jgi:hypothetical protein